MVRHRTLSVNSAPNENHPFHRPLDCGSKRGGSAELAGRRNDHFGAVADFAGWQKKHVARDADNARFDCELGTLECQQLYEILDQNVCSVVTKICQRGYFVVTRRQAFHRSFLHIEQFRMLRGKFSTADMEYQNYPAEWSHSKGIVQTPDSCFTVFTRQHRSATTWHSNDKVEARSHVALLRSQPGCIARIGQYQATVDTTDDGSPFGMWYLLHRNIPLRLYELPLWQ